MARLSFERPHKLGKAGARQAAQRVADEMTDRYSVRCQWRDDVLCFERPGVKGTLTIEEDCVRLDAALGILLAGFKPRIEARLDQNFERYFG